MLSFRVVMLIALAFAVNTLATNTRFQKVKRPHHHHADSKQADTKHMKCGGLQVMAYYKINDKFVTFEDKVRESDGRRAWTTKKGKARPKLLQFQECDSEVLNARNTEHWQYGVLHLSDDPQWCLRSSAASDSSQTTIVLDKCDYRDSDSPQRRKMWGKRRGEDFVNLLNAPMQRNGDGTLRQLSKNTITFNDDDRHTNRYGGSMRVVFHRYSDGGNSRVAMPEGFNLTMVPVDEYKDDSASED